jgi:hypothetical protein
VLSNAFIVGLVDSIAIAFDGCGEMGMSVGYGSAELIDSAHASTSSARTESINYRSA